MGRAWNELTVESAQEALEFYDCFTLEFVSTEETLGDGDYLGPFGLRGAQDNVGPVMPWSAQLVSYIAWRNDPASDLEIDVCAGADEKFTISFANGEQTATDTQLTYNFNLGDVVNCKVGLELEMLAGRVSVLLMFRRRSTA